MNPEFPSRMVSAEMLAFQSHAKWAGTANMGLWWMAMMSFPTVFSLSIADRIWWFGCWEQWRFSFLASSGFVDLCRFCRCDFEGGWCSFVEPASGMGREERHSSIKVRWTHLQGRLGTGRPIMVLMVWVATEWMPGTTLALAARSI